MSGKANFYVPRPMDKLIALSATSEQTGHPIEHALDRQLFTYWEPTTTGSNAIVLDLQNGMQERITNAADRNFSSTVNWANVDMGTFTIGGGTLTVEGNDTNNYCELAAAGLTAIVAGRTYRMTYTATGTSGNICFATDAGEVVATIIDGTANSATFTATLAATKLRIVAVAISATTVLDNLSLIDITDATNYAVKALAVWIYNSLTPFGASCGLLVEYSDNNSTWTTYFDPDVEDEMTYGGTGTALRVYVSASAAQSHRYWRITLHDATAVMKVAQILLLSEFAPDAYSTYPQIEEEITFNNHKVRGDNNLLYVEPGTKTPTYSFARRFSFYGATKYAAMRNFFLACYGGALPVLFEESSVYYLCYLVTEEWKCNATEYLYYQVTLDFETLPYVADGNTI